MRVSTTMQFTRNLSYIQKANTSVDDASTTYNTGLKFNTAGQDPAGMSSKVKYEGAIASYTQYIKDAGLANNTLAEEETALESMWNTLSTISTRLIQTVDSTNNQDSLDALADEIEQYRDQLFDLMNSKNTDGEYIFSGAQSNLPTYTTTSDGHYTCQADGASRSVQVAPSVTVQVSDSGLDIFENCPTARSMTATGSPAIAAGYVSTYGDFEDLYTTYYTSDGDNTNDQLYIVCDDGKFSLYSSDPTATPTPTPIDSGEIKTDGTLTVKGMEFNVSDYDYSGTITIQLEEPNTDNILNVLTQIVSDLKNENLTSEEKTALISKAQTDVDIAMNRYDSYRGKVGARQKTIETLIESDTSLKDIKTESKANVSEADAFESASDLLQAQQQLQVSRQIYSSLSKQTLFDYI